MNVTADGWRDYGDISASDPQYAVSMSCERCRVRWRGCADVFECPVCGEGTAPWLPASAPACSPVAAGVGEAAREEEPAAGLLAPLLEGWANQIATRFRAPVYLVGSALREAKPRDVDVRVVLPTDEAFVQRYGIDPIACEKVGPNASPHEVVRYRTDVAKLGAWATRHHSKGLNFDVQVTTAPMVHMRGHADKPRIRLDKLGDFEELPAQRPTDDTKGDPRP